MHVDWSRVKEMHDEIGAEDFDEIADMFLDEVAEAIDNLEAATERSNMEADLHFIKGSALNIGFASLATIAGEWEAKIRDQIATKAPIDEIRASHASCIEEFSNQKTGQLSAA